MTALFRRWLWLLGGSLGVFSLGAMTFALVAMRSSECAEVTYDGGIICLGNSGQGAWFESELMLLIVPACWLSSSLIIPLAVAFKTESSSWALVAFFLVVASSIAGDLGARLWVQREYPARYWPNSGGGPPIAFLNIVFALFVTLIGSAIAAEFSRDRVHQRE
jgi:hypothetical protein